MTAAEVDVMFEEYICWYCATARKIKEGCVMETKKEKAAERVAVKRDAAVHKETVEACIEVVQGVPGESAVQGALKEQIVKALEGLLAD